MEQQTLYYVLIILVALSTILPVLTSYVNRKRQQKALEEQLENANATYQPYRLEMRLSSSLGCMGKSSN